MGRADSVLQKIHDFRRKYYLNLFVRGFLLSATIVLLYYLVAAVTEHLLWLDTTGRLIIFSSFIAVSGACIYWFLRNPLRWWFAKKGMNELQSAKLIGQSLPDVRSAGGSTVFRRQKRFQQKWACPLNKFSWANFGISLPKFPKPDRPDIVGTLL